MSAGKFIDAKYQANDGKIYPIRIQPETKTTLIGGDDNNEPIQDFTGGLPTVKVSGGRRGFGVHPRGVVLELQENGSGVTAEYKAGQKYRVPILTTGVWNGINKGDDALYLGLDAKVKSKYPELVN